MCVLNHNYNAHYLLQCVRAHKHRKHHYNACAPTKIDQDDQNDVLIALLCFLVLHFLADIKRTQAGMSKYLTTPPISALPSIANPSPLIAPTDHLLGIHEV